MPSREHRALQRSRSSARSIEAGLVPRTSPGAREPASLSGVCPPSATMTPTNSPPSRALRCSTSMTLATSSTVRGSKYRRSDTS